MRIGMEVHRRNQPYCMGTLYWQLNDCWPVTSWSSRDYYGNWKALHYTAQDVFAPISLSLNLNNDVIKVWGMSNFKDSIGDTLAVEIWNFDGEKAKQISKVVSIKSNTASLLFNKKYKLNENQFVIAKLKNKKAISKTIFATKVKNIIFKKPKFNHKWENNLLTIESDIPAFEVYLHGLDGHFSDNFFSLLPGEKKTIKFEGTVIAKNKLLIWSLYDLNK